MNTTRALGDSAIVLYFIIGLEIMIMISPSQLSSTEVVAKLICSVRPHHFFKLYLQRATLNQHAALQRNS